MQITSSRRSIVLISSAVLVFCAGAYSLIRVVVTPTSWADCVLANVGTMNNDIAAVAVSRDCSSRYGGNALSMDQPPLTWYRRALKSYSSGDDCVIHEAAGMVDSPRVMNGVTFPGARTSLVATACHQLYD